MAHLPRTIGNGVELITVQPSSAASHSRLPASIGDSSLASHEERLHGFADDASHPDTAPSDQQHTDSPVGFRVADDNEFLRWDIMIVFPSRGTIPGIRRSQGAAEQDALRNSKREEVLTALKAAGLLFKLFYNFGRDAICCKLSATVARLRIEAMRTGYLMQLPQENPYNGAWCEYTNDPRLIDLLPQRHSDPKRKRSSIFRQLDRIRLIEQIIGAKTAHGGANLDLNKLVHDRFIIAHYALHDRQKLNELQTKWASWSEMLSDPPLHTVKNYFGETIGLYFAWLECYTQSLAPLAAVAVALYAYQEVTLDHDNIFVPIFALLTSIWASFFLRRWQRENVRLTANWGTRNFERAEVPRPQFWGDMRLNPINGRLNVWFSPVQRALRVCFSQAVITLLLAVVCISLVALLVLKVSIAGTNGASIISGVANGVIILMLNAVYKKIAVALNDFENHRTQTEYEDQLIIKVFLFQFCNSFISLFYIAYFKSAYGILGFSQACENSCLSELRTQMGSLFITCLSVGNAVEVLQPPITAWLTRKWDSVRFCCSLSDGDGDAAAAPRRMRYAESQCELLPYDSTIDDYVEMSIQFAYVNFFVVAFPLAPAIAYVSNLVEHRLDAIKLVFQAQRPFPRASQDIGSWSFILQLISIISIFHNGFLLAFTSNSLSSTGMSWVHIVALFQNAAFLVKGCAEFCIHDTPEDVSVLIARQEYVISHYIHNVEDDDDEDALFIRPDEATVIADGDLSDSDDAAASGLLGITNGISILGRKVSML